MSLTTEERPVRGFIFTCTNRSEQECFERKLFATDKVYGPIVIRIRKGDLLFLHNLDSDILWGIFKAVTDGSFNIDETEKVKKFDKFINNIKKLLNRKI
jgi:hypothetical protein